MIFEHGHDPQVWNFFPLRIPYPVGFDPVKNDPVYVRRKSKWGYSNMIEWWHTLIWNHPAIRSLDFYLRLDTDSGIMEDFLIDPFIFMSCNSYVYGYHQVMFDELFVTRGLWRFMLDWYRSHSDITSDLSNFPSFHFPSNSLLHELRVPMIYNNFEIAYVPFWTQERVQQLIKDVDATHDIYLSRWGDAPLRFFELVMFAKENETICWDFDYHHSIESASETRAIYELGPFEDQKDINKLQIALGITSLVLFIILCTIICFYRCKYLHSLL